MIAAASIELRENPTRQLPLRKVVRPIERAPLTDGAFDRLITNLTNYGSRLDPRTEGGRRHREALRAILDHYTGIAEGRIKGRHVFPLPTAMGKTQSIVAWCAEVCARGLPYTVVICQEPFV